MNLFQGYLKETGKQKLISIESETHLIPFKFFKYKSIN